MYLDDYDRALIVHGRCLPSENDLERGGIVGSVEIVNLVTESKSKWFSGPYGFVLRDPQPLPFRPCKGALGLFHVPPSTHQPPE